MKSILLFKIAGVKYYDREYAKNIPEGSTLDMYLEPNNPHDPKAVAVYHNDIQLGHVPRPLNEILFHLLEVGYPLVFIYKDSVWYEVDCQVNLDELKEWKYIDENTV